MKNIIAVCTKELYTYFVSPIAYFICFVFAAITGLLFSSSLFRTSGIGSAVEVMHSVFGSQATILIFFTPVITMKLFAEERKSGTIELLLTSPITDMQIVLGKYIASWILLLIMIFLTLIFPVLTGRFGPLDGGLLITGYFGLILISSCFIAFGLLMSSMSKNQIVAALTSFGFFIILWVISILAASAGPVGKYLSYMSFLDHYNEFALGVIQLRDVVYYVSFTGVCLYATVKSIESSKWR